MNVNIKPLITLFNINSLPDGYVHSKISFLKSIINEQQNPQIRQMKQKMYKLTYTVKNIGIHGQQIGISSKRVPLKEKQEYTPSELKKDQNKQIFIKKYIPHNSFFSQPLIPIKKLKTQESQDKNHLQNTFLLSTSRMNPNQYSQTNHFRSQSKFSQKVASKSKLGQTFIRSSKLQSLKAKKLVKQDKLEATIQKMKRSSSEQQLPLNKFQNRKSFAKLLKECGKINNEEVLMTLNHEQNPLFKKIKKLKQISAIKTIDKYERYRSSGALNHNMPSQSTNRYRTYVSSIQTDLKRKTLSKNF